MLCCSRWIIGNKAHRMSGEHTAFFYGTLMAPEIFFSVCYGDDSPSKAIRDLHTFTPAILNDYCRHRVQYADYPAVVPEKGRSVRGVYATGLTDANVEKLDRFEGSDYERITVKIQLLGKEEDEATGKYRDTFVYVFLCHEDLEKREWDFEEFRQEKMKRWTRGPWKNGQCADEEAVVNWAT